MIDRLRAYHGDPLIKAQYVERFNAHRATDSVIQGQGYINSRGGFVGCTLGKYDYLLFSTELGWPEWLARLAEAIFEGLPKEDAVQFGTDLLDAVQVGCDLETVKIPFLIDLQQRNLARFENHIEECPEANTLKYVQGCRQAMQEVIDHLLSESDLMTVVKLAQSAVESAESAWSMEIADKSGWSAEIWPMRLSRLAGESARSVHSAVRAVAHPEESARVTCSALSARSAAIQAKTRGEGARLIAESETITQRDTLTRLINPGGVL